MSVAHIFPPKKNKKQKRKLKKYFAPPCGTNSFDEKLPTHVHKQRQKTHALKYNALQGTTKHTRSKTHAPKYPHALKLGGG